MPVILPLFNVRLDTASLNAIIAGVSEHLTKEIKIMGTTLEGQVQADTAAIRNDISQVADSINTLGAVAQEIQQRLANAGTITPGTTISADDVASLDAAKASADALVSATTAAVAALQQIANPGTPAATAPATA